MQVNLIFAPTLTILPLIIPIGDCMIFTLMIQKSAPGISGLVFLIIGILIVLLAFDSIVSYIKAKLKKRNEKPDDIDLMFPDPPDQDKPTNNKISM